MKNDYRVPLVSDTVQDDTNEDDDNIAQWESARPNLDLPKIEARSEVSA